MGTKLDQSAFFPGADQTTRPGLRRCRVGERTGGSSAESGLERLEKGAGIGCYCRVDAGDIGVGTPTAMPNSHDATLGRRRNSHPTAPRRRVRPADPRRRRPGRFGTDRGTPSPPDRPSRASRVLRAAALRRRGFPAGRPQKARADQVLSVGAGSGRRDGREGPRRRGTARGQRSPWCHLFGRC